MGACMLTEMAERKTGWGGRREGAGRRRLVADPVDVLVRLDRPDAEASKALAEARGISVPELIRRILRSYLRRINRRQA